MPQVKHGRGSITVWTAIILYFAAPFITINDKVTARDYVSILGEQVHSLVQRFFNIIGLNSYRSFFPDVAC